MGDWTFDGQHRHFPERCRRRETSHVRAWMLRFPIGELRQVARSQQLIWTYFKDRATRSPLNIERFPGTARAVER